MRRNRNTVFLLLAFLSACNGISNDVSAVGIPTPTPFQPQTGNASNPVYAASAPTPSDLPTLTPSPLPPTEVVLIPEIVPVDVTVPPFILDNILNPLTGLPPPDGSLMDRRPMAIKVANYPRYIRPQSGLTLADQVFEYYIEDGLTRFVAVFYGNNSEWVGPVRSGRYFDEHIQRMYQAYLVFKFADPRELNYFRGSDFADFLVVPSFSDCPPFHLLPEREATVEVYNNSYFNTVLWGDCVDRKGLDNHRPFIRSGFFTDSAPFSESPGTKVFTFFSVDAYHYWEYDPGTQQYYRYQEVSDTRDGRAESYDVMIDRVTSQPVHASNVVVLLAYHTFANAYDEEDEVFQIDLTGSGEAYVFRDGIAIPAKWHRTNKEQPLLFSALDGSIIYFKPGITFYEVIGSRSYADHEGGEWKFRHDAP